MANLPEKNITTVDKITSIPSNTNLYINANGEFRQATVDDVLKASPVIADSIANQYKNASGSPLLLTDSAKGVAIDFNAKGRSTQDGEPNPDYPQAIKSVADSGYFDGELQQGVYSYSDGAYAGSGPEYVNCKNSMPCKGGDIVKLTVDTDVVEAAGILWYANGVYLNASHTQNTNWQATAPSGATEFAFNLYRASGITPQTAKHICVTINGKYALIVDSMGKNLLNNTASVTDSTYKPYKKSQKYIPISAPLRGLGEVTDVASLSECEVTRKIAYERITTVFKYNADVDNYCYYCRFGNIGSVGNALSNRLLCKSTTIITVNGIDNIGIYETPSYGGVVYLNVGKYLTENTVEGMETWLAENPTYVQYVLAEPTTESIEPTDVDTFEGVTHISVSDDADMEVEYPTSKVAGIASIGWSKGRRAEYDLEQLKAQMLALQTTIVSTV